MLYVQSSISVVIEQLLLTIILFSEMMAGVKTVHVAIEHNEIIFLLLTIMFIKVS